MSDTPQEPQADTPAEAAPETPVAPVEAVHKGIVDAAERLVQAVENIYEDTNLRGEVVAAKNELRNLLERLKGDVQGTPPAAPPAEAPQ